MKSPRYEVARGSTMEKTPAAESMVHHPKASPLKSPVKPQCLSAEVTTVLISHNDNTRAVHNKENSTSRVYDRSVDDGFEDSGYLSLHNSRLDEHHRDEEDDHMQVKPASALLVSATWQGKTPSPNNSPSKIQGRANSNCSVYLSASSTPGDHPRRTAAYSLSSTPTDNHKCPNLPIINFQRDVCEELARSYRKNKRYDWSVVAKVAENHLLDRVIGGQMGLEYIDMFTSLLSRNMRSILADILAMLGDMDLISCKKVSSMWRRIVCEDYTAFRRCQRAEALGESNSSQRTTKHCGLTRDASVSRVVLSCMQTLASSTQSSPSLSSSSSSLGCKVNRRVATSQKGSTLNPPCTRFKEYMQAASSLKQHESLRHCKHCGSPAIHLSEAQRATCTRASCRFDFCTRCKEAFHGSSPCRTVQPRSQFDTSKTTSILPGSARSKRNVRRL